MTTETQEVSTALAVQEKRLTMRERLADSLELALDQLSEKDATALITGGDLGVLAPQVRTAWYIYRCKQLGLDPMTRPFDLIALNGKVVLYANRACADQLRAKHNISVQIVDKQMSGDMLTIWVEGKMPDGRAEVNCGSIFIGGLRGEPLSNAIQKCMTKALRRLTLAMTGAGLLDSSEVDSIPRSRRDEVIDIGQETV